MKPNVKVVASEPTRISVLVADDDRQVLATAQKLLTDCGYEVICVEDGVGAVQVLGAQKVDVMLCDLLMPRISGFEVLEAAREMGLDLVSMAICDYPDAQSARRAFQMGASDCLIKPIRFQALPIAIERCLTQRRMEKERWAEQVGPGLVQAVRALAAATNHSADSGEAAADRIADLAILIAGNMGLTPHDTRKLELAALLHDIGYIGVDDSMLQKQDKLTGDEWDHITKHVEIADSILSRIDGLSEVAEIVRHHHERFDGTGYPDKLTGADIPLLSRILAVADTFEALTSNRPYRVQLSEQEAFDELRRAAGKQLDPEVVTAFVGCGVSAQLKAA